MFYTNVVQKNKTHILYPITFYRKSCRLWDNVKMWWSRRGRKWQDGGAVHAGVVRLHARMDTAALGHPHALPIPLSVFLCLSVSLSLSHTHTHTHKYAFPHQQCFVNAPQCYVVRTLPVLLYIQAQMIRRLKQHLFKLKLTGSYMFRLH
jgi:hypothetical protein